jgi:hypothetical protein
MDNTNNPEQPESDVSQIEGLLGRFQPQPSPRFYHKMSMAPWMKTSPKEKPGISRDWMPSRRLAWGLAALLLIITLFGFSLYPPLRAIARQIMFSFIPSLGDQLEVQVTLANPEDLYHFADPENFPLSIAVAQEQAGFPLREIASLPIGLSFTGARYDAASHAVILLYQGKDYKIFLTQRPIDHGQDVFSIGASAQVETVQIGNIQGEYVVGGWKAVSAQPDSRTATPGSTITLSATWDNTLPQYTLRWQSAGYAYELRTTGVGSPTQSELISLANGLK